MITIPRESGVIYAFHAGDHRYRYVGKTTRLLRIRINEHFNDCRKGVNHYLYKWMRKVGIENIHLEILDRSPDKEMLADLEICWIAKLRGEGFALTNTTDGGEGRLGAPLSAEARAKISAARKAHKASPEARANMSAAAKARTGRFFSEETRAKISASNSGRFTSEETRLKMSLSNACRKLQSGDVVQILEMLASGVMGVKIAETYFVNQKTVSDIKCGRTWKHIPRPEGFATC